MEANAESRNAEMPNRDLIAPQTPSEFKRSCIRMIDRQNCHTAIISSFISVTSDPREVVRNAGRGPGPESDS
jgi:hypothetical protein